MRCTSRASSSVAGCRRCPTASGRPVFDNPVDVIFRVQGHIVVDHVGDAFHVDARAAECRWLRAPGRALFETLLRRHGGWPASRLRESPQAEILAVASCALPGRRDAWCGQEQHAVKAFILDNCCNNSNFKCSGTGTILGIASGRNRLFYLHPHRVTGHLVAQLDTGLERSREQIVWRSTGNRRTIRRCRAGSRYQASGRLVEHEQLQCSEKQCTDD